MRSHEAIQRAIAGKTIQHAQRQGKSSSLLHKWQEPHTDFTDSGTINPLDRIEMIIEAALSLGTTSDHAYSPIQYLAHRFGLVCIPLPQKKGNKSDLISALADSIKEFGDLASAAAIAMKDGRITKGEAQHIEDEWRQMVTRSTMFVEDIKEAANR